MRSQRQQSTNTPFAGVASMETLEQRCLLSAGLYGSTLRVVGDGNPDNLNDTIVIAMQEADPTLLEVAVNGEIVSVVNVADVKRIRVAAGAGDDTVEVSLDRVTTSQEAGADVLSLTTVLPIVKGIRIDGGAGDDTVELDLGSLEIPAKVIGRGGCDILTGSAGRDRLIGGSGDDVLTGCAGNDILIGGRGDDTLKGGVGNDRLVGGAGTDLLEGEAGNDRIFGGGGADTIDGGDGDDRIAGGGARDWLYGRGLGDRLLGWRKDIVLDSGIPELQQTGSVGSGAVAEWVIDTAVEQFRDLFGTRWAGHKWWGWAEGGVMVTMDAAEVPVALNGELDYSGTNTQVDGVDEADVVETDGEYIYTLSQGQLVILDALPAEDAEVVSTTEIEGTAQAMYLHGDRLTVISVVNHGWWWGTPIPILRPIGIEIADGPWAPECEYKSQFKVTVFDVADRSEPEEVEETTIDGRLVSSRAIDDKVYLVVSNADLLARPTQVYDEAADEWVYESEAEYRDRVAALLTDQLPQYTGEAGEEVSGPLIDADSLFIPDDPAGNQMMTIAVLDIDDGLAEPVTTTTVVGISGEVYVSPESLYVVSGSWTWSPMIVAAGASRSVSHIYKFDLTDPAVPLAATGTVPGSVLNQFSMDEYDGRFRIATTSWASERANNLFVLEQHDDNLQIVGSLVDLAVTERIYSARFMGEKVFLVTFRQVDPLFAIDLSDPTAPTVAGELKIPGYSAYLHPIGEDRLIGFGMDADEQTGRTRGMQLSVFDVSDLSNPIRDDVYLFNDGVGWSYSEALWDHHAFAYFPAQQILALPVHSRDGGEVQVFRITDAGDESIIRLGQVDHDSQVRRNVRIGEYLYSISETAVKVDPIDLSGEQVASVPLTEG